MTNVKSLPKVRGSYRFNAPLAGTNWFGVGGAAEVLFKPEDAADLADFIKHKPSDLPLTVIGVGSNLIVRDGGLDGVVIRLGRGFTDASLGGDVVSAGAASTTAAVGDSASGASGASARVTLGAPPFGERKAAASDGPAAAANSTSVPLGSAPSAATRTPASEP